MISESPLPGPTGETLAPEWRERVAAMLQSGETVTAWVETDLDDRLDFAAGLLALTDRRLLAIQSVAAASGVHEWPLHGELRLAMQDHAGVGSLALTDPVTRLAVWRFTLGQGAAALRLIDAFERLLAGDPSLPSAGGVGAGACTTAGPAHRDPPRRVAGHGLHPSSPP